MKHMWRDSLQNFLGNIHEKENLGSLNIEERIFHSVLCTKALSVAQTVWHRMN
jgi:hypothetical protein